MEEQPMWEKMTEGSKIRRGDKTKVLSIAYLIQLLLEGFNKYFFQGKQDMVIGGKIEAEDENMLMDLSNSWDQYGMKINVKLR